ncbi:S1 family peptidase, partial [Streptomyces sp. NPDC057654]
MPKRRVALAGAGVAVLAAASLTLQSANAAPAPTPDSLSVTSAGKLASKLSAGLKGDAAGSYYDAKAKKLVVNVLSQAA